MRSTPTLTSTSTTTSTAYVSTMRSTSSTTSTSLCERSITLTPSRYEFSMSMELSMESSLFLSELVKPVKCSLCSDKRLRCNDIISLVLLCNKIDIIHYPLLYPL
uniref:Uncharacterized protein n=1 Tax=Ditylenchus dipsaci TaxID=166011 RepID=A0A915E9L4_9BILA